MQRLGLGVQLGEELPPGRSLADGFASLYRNLQIRTRELRERVAREREVFRS